MSQTERLYELLKDYKPHRTDEILHKVYNITNKGIARIGARIYDVKKQKDAEIISWKDKAKPTLHWYQLLPKDNLEVWK